MENKKVDYNIEYAHIYTDETFGEEQIKSIELLKKIIIKLNKLNKSYTLTVLIDDYNPKEHFLDINNFINKCEELGYKPDFIAFESRLCSDKDLLLKKMSKKMSKEYKNYIKKAGKIPCSFLIAIWYLKRLGLIKTRKNEVIPLKDKRKPFIGRKIINILPKKYREVETKGLKIIKSTKFREYLNNISDILF